MSRTVEASVGSGPRDPPRSGARAARLGCWGAILVLAASWTWYVLVQAHVVHGYYDRDSDLGFTTWTFAFGRLQVSAVVLGLLWVALAGLGERVSRLRWSAGRTAWALIAMLVLNAVVVVGARRSAALWAGGPSADPSTWMYVAAWGLAAQVVAAVALGAVSAARASRG